MIRSSKSGPRLIHTLMVLAFCSASLNFACVGTRFKIGKPMIKIENTNKNEIVKGKIAIKEQPRGYTGLAVFLLYQEMINYRIEEKYEVTYQILGTPSTIAAIVAGAGITYITAGLIWIIDKGEVNDFLDWLYGSLETQELDRKLLESKRTVVSVDPKPMPWEYLEVEIPENGTRSMIQTDENGEISVHLLEAVMDTRGSRDIHVNLRCPKYSGVKYSYVLAREDAATMYNSYVARVQANSRARVKTYSREQNLVEIDDYNYDFRVWKMTVHQFEVGKFIWDNAKLVRRGISLARALEITMPEFIIGFLITELSFRLIETTVMQ